MKKVALAVAAILALVMMALPMARAHATAPVQRTVYLTMYGWPDNDPPGPAIAYPRSGGFPTVHNQAGGTGTYADPITLASDQRELPIGTIVWITAYHKYAVMEDQCAECEQEWGASRRWHLDLWTGGQGVNPSTVLSREDDLTLDSATVIVHPPSNLSVDTTPLLQSPVAQASPEKRLIQAKPGEPRHRRTFTRRTGGCGRTGT